MWCCFAAYFAVVSVFVVRCYLCVVVVVVAAAATASVVIVGVVAFPVDGGVYVFCC